MTGASLPYWRARLAAAGLVFTALVSSCGYEVEPTGPSDDANAASPAIVSDPVAASSSSARAERAGLLATTVVYVSLPPGTFPTGVSASISNRRLGAAVPVDLVDGGLDPVPIQAEAGDTLAFAVDTGGTEPVRFDQMVPVMARPRVVRTDPPAGKRDVPLNLRIAVVFSEPMDRASITGATLGLERAGTLVAGEVTVSADGLEATFQPAAELLGDAEYTIVVGGGIRDADGSALEAPVRAGFTTGTLSGNAVALRFERQPVNAITGMTMSSVAVIPIDASGNPATGFTGNVHLAIGSNAGGGSLSGTTTRGGWSPSVEFYDLRIDRPGGGYTLIATAGGLSVTSSTFDVVPASELIAFWTMDLEFLWWPIRKPIDNMFVSTADGRAFARLEVGFWGFEPAWSPDGAKIAFTGGTLMTSEFVSPLDSIYIVNADGSGLTSLGLTGNGPAWSPDGSRIAFRRPKVIHLMNADGSGLTSLNQEGLGPPTWSPDGARIAFAGEDGIYIMNADGSGVRRLTSAGPAHPKWSPDGARIAFSWWWQPGNPHPADVFVINADGSELTNLTGSHPRLQNDFPAWSPEGRQIVYISTTDFGSTHNLYVMNADGSAAHRVHALSDAARFGDVRTPAWSPR